MVWQAVLMTIIALSALFGLGAYLFGLALKAFVNPVKKDIEHLKEGQVRLEAEIRELKKLVIQALFHKASSPAVAPAPEKPPAGAV